MYIYKRERERERERDSFWSNHHNTIDGQITVAAFSPYIFTALEHSELDGYSRYSSLILGPFLFRAPIEYGTLIKKRPPKKGPDFRKEEEARTGLDFTHVAKSPK